MRSFTKCNTTRLGVAYKVTAASRAHCGSKNKFQIWKVSMNGEAAKITTFIFSHQHSSSHELHFSRPHSSTSAPLLSSIEAFDVFLTHSFTSLSLRTLWSVCIIFVMSFHFIQTYVAVKVDSLENENRKSLILPSRLNERTYNIPNKNSDLRERQKVKISTNIFRTLEFSLTFHSSYDVNM